MRLFRRTAGRLGSIFDRPCSATVAAAGNSSKVLVAAGVNGLLGCSVRESAGAATAWRLRDGSVTGTVVAAFGAPTSGTGSPVLPAGGVAVPSGTLYLENVSGSGEVIAYWA